MAARLISTVQMANSWCTGPSLSSESDRLLEGPNIGGKISTEINPFTYIRTEGSCGAEIDWYSIGGSKHWSIKSDARVSEAESIRLYNSDIDLCLRYEIHCRISSSSKLLHSAIREVNLASWEKSKFALLPKWDKWPYPDIPEPDEKIEWPWNKTMLCGWHHKHILDGFISLRSASIDSDFFTDSNIDKDESTLSNIENYLRSDTMITPVSPREARYMLALVSYDPFQEIESGIYITGEVVSYPETIPSPINPKSRYFLCELVILTTDINEESIIGYMDTCLEIEQNSISISRDEDYLVVCFIPSGLEIESQCTMHIVDEIYVKATRIMDKISEKFSTDKCLNICTKDYWKSIHGTTFGLDWRESLLPVEYVDGKPVANKNTATKYGM